MLINGSFEEWRNDELRNRAYVFEVETSGGKVINAYQRDRGEVSNPAGWLTWYAHQRGDNPVPWDDQNTIGWSEPEVRLTDPVHGRQRSGNHAACLFTYCRIHEAGLLQQVKVTKGQALQFSAFAHGWIEPGDDPNCSLPGCGPVAIPEGQAKNDNERAALFKVGIDPTGGLDPYATSVVWGEGWHVYNGYHELTCRATAESETVTVFLKSSTLWPVTHNDAYWDDATLTTGRDYHCTVNVLPQEAPLTRAQEIMAATYAERQSVLFSHDDAARLTDQEGDRVYLWDLAPAQLAEYKAWYRTRGSKATVTIPGYEPMTGNNPLSFHLQERGPWAEVLEYVRKAKPNVIKVFDGGLGAEIKAANQGTQVVLRHHIDNDKIEWICKNPTVGLPWFFEQVGNENRERFMRGELDYLETPNNEANSVGVPLATWVKADLEFVRRLKAAMPGARPVVATVSVGCPEPNDYPLLIPLAQAAAQAGGAFGYHAYWPSNQQGCFLESDWPWHAGRWCEMDKVFVAAGVKVDWILSECAPCGGVMHPGWFEYDAGAGWKSEKCCNGDWQRARGEMLRFKELLQCWNAENGGRCLGGTLFTICGWDWEYFRLEGEQILSLIE